MYKEWFQDKIRQYIRRYTATLKWILFAVFVGLILGVCGSLFHECIDIVTSIRLAHPLLLLLLPLGGVLIHVIYGKYGSGTAGGTNLVLESIHEDKPVPLRLAPLIFIATTISHLSGASVGREGAALQLGGSIGHFVGVTFRLSDRDRKTLVMTGMSAAFSAMFGTPLTAAVFPMEVVTVGIMQYSALLPCAIASFTARGVAILMGMPATAYELGEIPAFAPLSAVRVSVLACLAGIFSILFCIALQHSERLAESAVKNRYARAVLLGAVLLILTHISGSQIYNGAGGTYIPTCIAGEQMWYAFLVKAIFTILSICAGYKGGEIVPSFFIGAAFGGLFGAISGFSPALCAAVGMTAFFSGVTNCPLSSFLIACEMFGYGGASYYMLAAAFGYVISSYWGLYTGQKIMYSKFGFHYINKRTE